MKNVLGTCAVAGELGLSRVLEFNKKLCVQKLCVLYQTIKLNKEYLYLV